MSALDNNEVNHTIDLDDVKLADMVKNGERNGQSKEGGRKPKRILHFSDGTMEEYDDEETDEESHPHMGDGVEEPFQKTKDKSSVDSAPPVNPKTLSWPSWVKHYTMAGGSKTLGVLDSMGESVAYYLGITTPKYQYEIDEYNRVQQDMKNEKKAQEAEFASWATNSTSATTTPIVKEKIDDLVQQLESMTPISTEDPAPTEKVAVTESTEGGTK